MGVNISIKNVPTEQVDRLKQRAKANHRSLQGELMALIALHVGAHGKPMTVEEIAANGKKLGLRTPSESVQMIREDRDR